MLQSVDSIKTSRDIIQKQAGRDSTFCYQGDILSHAISIP